MEQAFWREVGQFGESDGEMETPSAWSNLSWTSRLDKNTGVGNLGKWWDKGKAQVQALESQFSSQSLFSGIMLVA